MRFVTLLSALALCLSLAACGKRPNTLEAPEGSSYPRTYPAIEQVP